MATETTVHDDQAAAADRAVMDLLAGMWRTQAMATAARLSIPDLLAGGPLTADEIASKTGAHPGATRRLLRMLAGIGVFSAVNGRYALTEISERLREDRPGTLKHMFIAETDGVHWRCWEKVVDAVRTGLPRPLPVFGMPAFDYYGKHKDEGEEFGRAMANVSGFASRAVLEAYDFGGLKTICDIGGGNGSMVLAILEKYRGMRGIVADLPYIGDQAQESIRAAGASDRCCFEATDFFRSVPQGADGHLLKFVLHDWNDEECAAILKNCRAAIAPGGRLMALEIIVPEESRPDFSHFMDMNMLVMTGGMERTEKEYAALLARGGFRLARVVPASAFSLIEALPA
jgi:hypothetical protein